MENRNLWSKSWVYWTIAILLVVIDQVSKIYVKTHFTLGESVMVIPTWFRLSFTENPGVAFGMEWGGVTGKYFLTVFRIIFSILIALYLNYNIRKKEYPWILFAGSLILAGAIGNVIDGIFYGVIFSESGFHMQNVATFVPFGQGYSSLLQGKVVDMFYFPIYEGFFPMWVPQLGGQPFTFFNAIFNVADACISVGLVIFLIVVKKSRLQ